MSSVSVAQLSTTSFSLAPALVLLPSSRQVPTGLGTIRGLGRLGVPVIAVGSDVYPPAAASRYVTNYMQAPDYKEREAEFIHWLQDLGRRFGSRGVLFVSADDQAALVSLHVEELSPYWRYDYLSIGCLNACLNKALTADVAEKAGVLYPQTIVCADIASIGSTVASAPMPSIVKPLGHAICDGGVLQRLEGFKATLKEKAFRAATKEELHDALTAALGAGAPCIVQQEIAGDVGHCRSVGIYMDRQQQILGAFIGRKARQYPTDIGTGTLCEALPPAPQLLEASVAVLRAADYSGIVEVEWKLSDGDGEPWLIEMNPRPWAWIAASEVAGVNLAHIAYCSHTDDRVEQQQQREFAPKWIDLVSDFDGVRATRRNRDEDALTLREYRASLSGPKEYAFFAKDDWRPGVERVRREFASRLYNVPGKLKNALAGGRR